MENEIWKDVPNYEGLYMVSNLGNVKSLERVVRHNLGGDKILKEKLLKPHFSKKYVSVSLRKENKSKTISLHQVVAFAFLGHESMKMNLVVHHIDDNKHNNNVSNLQIVTARQNTHNIEREKTSVYIGVYWGKRHKKWVASIRVGKKLTHIGYFKDELDAKKAYDEKLSLINKQNQIGYSKNI
jgi:hypothetical protein